VSKGTITGWGAALPPTVVTNADLADYLDTSEAWIVDRTGISERRVGGTVSDLAVEASVRAIHRAGIRADDVDMLILATTTPDMAVPATAARVHHELGLSGGAFDLNAACSGFVYGLVSAYGAVATGARHVLVVGAECLSKITDRHDRGTAVLFGDGAGAVVLEASGEDSLLGFDLGVDGSGLEFLWCEHGGVIKMEGREVFRRAVRATVLSAASALDRAELTSSDIALFVPHQANLRIIEAAGSRLGLPMERTAIVLDRTGNTSSASIPLALAEASDAGRIRRGDNVLLSGFGAGFSWASAVLRWGRGSGPVERETIEDECG
jgi:3-oxoacyl-[acyl-carrier-protein] synthase III